MSLLSKVNHVFTSMQGKCINIGCGQDVRRGWVNCDLFPNSNLVRRFDMTSKDDLSWLEETKSHMIECNHVIGYLNYAQTRNFFSACYNSLEKSGKLILEFPDIIKISKKLTELDAKDSNRDDYIELVRAVYAYDHVDAFAEKFDKKTYVFGWSGNFVRDTLKVIGFDQILIKSPREHSRRDWRDTRIEAIKTGRDLERFYPG
jgi:predicted SAM-dependent methyltransferase